MVDANDGTRERVGACAGAGACGNTVTRERTMGAGAGGVGRVGMWTHAGDGVRACVGACAAVGTCACDTVDAAFWIWPQARTENSRCRWSFGPPKPVAAGISAGSFCLLPGQSAKTGWELIKVQ